MNSRSSAPAISLLIVLSFAAPALPQEFKFTHASEIDKIGHRDLGKGVNFYSLDKEKEIGKQLAAEVERSSRMVNDSEISAYVDALAQKVAQNSDARMPVVVRVVDSKVVDAITLPGGNSFINSATILEAKSEAELAGVIAFGIAHTAMRSGTAQVTRGTIMGLADIPAMVFIPYSWAGWGINQGQNLAIPLIQLEIRAKYTLAADYFAVQYLYVTGYDPCEFAAFVERLSEQPTTASTKLNTFFPSGAARAAKLRAEIADILPARDDAIHTSSEFERIKERIRTVQPSTESTRPTLRKESDNDSAKLP